MMSIENIQQAVEVVNRRTREFVEFMLNAYVDEYGYFHDGFRIESSAGWERYFYGDELLFEIASPVVLEQGGRFMARVDFKVHKKLRALSDDLENFQSE